MRNRLNKQNKYRFRRITPICIVCVVALLCLGCDGPIVKRALPAPPRPEIEVTLEGKIRRFWGGDNFEFSHGLNLHYVLLRGVDAPDPGQPWYRESRAMAGKLTRGKTVAVQAVGRDEMMRDIADVIVPVGKTKGDFKGDSFNLGLELIRRGFARYNPEGFKETDADLAGEFVRAENEAKAAEVGIWTPSN
jgi:endonuclease YncB( thermonuclease family)